MMLLKQRLSFKQRRGEERSVSWLVFSHDGAAVGDCSNHSDSSDRVEERYLLEQSPVKQ